MQTYNVPVNYRTYSGHIDAITQRVNAPNPMAARRTIQITWLAQREARNIADYAVGLAYLAN